MHEYKTIFIQLALTHKVLSFGEFTLKSGRKSPYFFNAGRFQSGQALATLGKCYAEKIEQSGLNYDVLFGPAYKGIPLATVTATALSNGYGKDVPIAYNRKEAKEHGEGGKLVGADLAGKRVLIIDDVITAGTAVREVLSMVKDAGGEPVGVMIGLNRQERGESGLSAPQELERDFGLSVYSIVNLADLIGFLSDQQGNSDLIARVKAYREEYGV